MVTLTLIIIIRISIRNLLNLQTASVKTKKERVLTEPK